MADQYRAAGVDHGTTQDALMDGGKPQQRKGGICAPFHWYKEKPLQRYPFLIFLAFGVLCFLWLIIYATGSSTGYILAGVFAILMSLYGANHFRILLGLKEQVDRMSKNNREFREQNAKLKQEVDKLSRAREQLTGVEQGLRESNMKLKENVEKFRQLDENLSKLADSNIEGLEKLQKSSQSVMKTMHQSLIRHEKEILNKIYDHLEWKDKSEGLSEEEFNEFWAQCPKSYQERFKQTGQTFQQIAGNDGILDYDEFRKMVDEFAEKEAKAGGSQ